MNYKQSIGGGIVALILANACCWLPALIVVLGGAASLLSFSESLEQYSGLLMISGAALLIFGLMQYRKRMKTKQTESKEVVLQSTITCPKCGATKKEIMPTDACAFFYKCESCEKELRPKDGDCCVYCSYGSVPCPPIQMDKNCC